jgi:hypothetical protein
MEPEQNAEQEAVHNADEVLTQLADKMAIDADNEEVPA